MGGTWDVGRGSKLAMLARSSTSVLIVPSM